MPRILRRPLSVDDFAEIWDFIADDSFVEADRWVENLDRELGTLLPNHRWDGDEKNWALEFAVIHLGAM